MRALSVRSPWWWWILNGGKIIENRSRITHRRGTIYIQASKYWNIKDVCQDHMDAMNIYRKVNQEFLESAPPIDTLESCLGHVVGTVDIVDCVTNHDSPWFHGPYGYVLENPKIIEPFLVQGKLGFFKVEEK